MYSDKEYKIYILIKLFDFYDLFFCIIWCHLSVNCMSTHNKLQQWYLKKCIVGNEAWFTTRGIREENKEGDRAM
jgi:hypothetical protein